MQDYNHARFSVKLMNTFDMKQKTTAPERVTPCTSSLIDHVYVSDTSCVQEQHYVPLFH